MTMSSKNSHCDLDPSPIILKLILIQDIVILHIWVKLNQNQSINKGTKAMIMFFSKNNHCDLDLGSRMLKLNLI